MLRQNSQTRERIHHHAILIGIDAYPIDPLKSCVEDVQAIQKHLTAVLPQSVNIELLEAANTTIVDSESPAGHEIQYDPHWPSHENVYAAFDRIAAIAEPGDFVYIHFSGHGTQGAPCDEFSERSRGDLALVLLRSPGSRDTKPLWGADLAARLRSMVEKKLIVTLVLDCCFSGGVYRDRDPETRCFLSQNIDLANRPTPLVLESSWRGGSRDVSMQPNWLIDPEGYSILTACGPLETATGITTPNGQRHGALTYYLLEVLVSYEGLHRPHRDIHRYLCSELRSKQAQQRRQTPMLYGNAEQGFFGNVKPTTTRSSVSSAAGVAVFRDSTDRNVLRLQAGFAHGIAIGDVYFLQEALSSGQGTDIHPDSDAPAVKASVAAAQVVKCGGLTSILALLNEPTTDSIPFRLHGVAYPDKTVLVPPKTNLPSPVGTLGRAGTAAAAAFEVDTTATDNNLKEVAEHSKHLLRFKALTKIRNLMPSPQFQSSFRIQLASQTATIEHAPSPQGATVGTRVKQNGRDNIFTLTITNLGGKDLFIHIFDFGHIFWQIENVLKTNYFPLHPQNTTPDGQHHTGVYEKRLKTIVPIHSTVEGQDKRNAECRDIIRVIVTNQAANFDCILLPRLGQDHPSPLKPAAASRLSHDQGDHDSEEWMLYDFVIDTLM